MKYLATLYTHFDAIQYIKFLKQKDIVGKLQPVPRKLSSSCGTCAVFITEEIDATFITSGCEYLYLVEDEKASIYQQVHF